MNKLLSVMTGLLGSLFVVTLLGRFTRGAGCWNVEALPCTSIPKEKESI